MFTPARFIAILLISVILPAVAAAQNAEVKALHRDASLSETQKWLVEAIKRYASYKSPVRSVEVKEVTFDRCSMKIATVRRSSAATHDALGVTTKTRSAKQEIVFDLPFIAPDGIELTDHIFPEFKFIKIKFREDAAATPSVLSRDHELVVKEEAGEAIRSALEYARGLCANVANQAR